MADNIEGSAAKSMAGSDKYNGGFVKNAFVTRFLGGIVNGGSGGGSGGGEGKTGNGWTAKDYKNYGDYTERERYQQGKMNEHAEYMKTLRDNEDLLTDINRQRASKIINGYGHGNQGGSTQQSKPGGRAAGTVSATKAPSQAAVNRQSKAASTYSTPSTGKKLDPTVKSQNAAARTYR